MPMTSSKFLTVACVAALGIISPVLVSCSSDNGSGDNGGVFARHSEEPSTPEAVLDGYKSASAIMSGSLKLNDMDKDTIKRIFSIYCAANEQFNAAREKFDVDQQDVFLGDFIDKKDQRFLDGLYKDIGFDQRVLVDEAVLNAKYDLFYYTLTTSLSGDESVSEDAASAVGELSPEDVAMDDDNTARVSLAAFNDEGEAVFKRDEGMWKLILDREQISEVTALGLSMLDMIMSNAEGNTPEDKGEFVATKVMEERKKRAQETESKVDSLVE